MARELPVNWKEIEQAVIAGVPARQVAKAMAEKTPGLADTPEAATERLYDAIRKKCSREKWPVPSSIIRRSQIQARVAAGVAKDAKEAACWKPGEHGEKQAATCAAMAGMGQVSLQQLERGDNAAEGSEGQEGHSVTFRDNGELIRAEGGGEALPTAPPTATELVTQSLATRGQTGLSLALDAALASLQSLQSSGDTVPIRSMQDLLTAVKATQAAAGLDKPSVAVAVSLNSGSNASIMAWEAVES